ncbi:MAG: acyl-CoA dehydrogenase family protein [Gammaproteobacteria bacterium AqS3]|nr:acyl-CoA dehydrogenase family protein [Gammaproteobacteria bacterium AqS3]
MDMNFSPEDLAFQQEVRGWIKENYTADMQEKMARSAHGYLPKEDQIRWQKALHKKGWIGLNWPVEYGGPGFTVTQRYLYNIEMGAAGAPGVMPFGLSMVAPVIMKFGTPEQKDRYLPDILASNVWWCQGYSEPGSGSDLASLKTRAEDRGDHYLVNGQKIWTTLAQHADWIFCLVRTADTGKRQEGISFLLIDMKTPGVTVRPIIMLDQTGGGEQEINEVFFEDVEVPKENLIGEEGKGWTCAKYLLEFERGNPYSAQLKKQITKVRRIASMEYNGSTALIDDPEFKARLAELEVQTLSMEFTELRILGSLSTGQNVGPESSLLKARGTEIGCELTELAMLAASHYGLVHQVSPHAERGVLNEPKVGPEHSFNTTNRYFNYRKAPIYAGSNEIQRNIIAKLVLGL